MKLIDKNKIDFYTIETDDSSGNEIIEVAFKEDIERLSEVEAIAKSVIDDIINKLIVLPISFEQERVINMCINIINNTIAESEEK